MSNLIKEDCFNLSTTLNSKSLWMHNVDTPIPEHTSKNKGNMNFEDQAMFKWRLVNSWLHTSVHLPLACKMDVLKLLQWWHGHIWLLMTPPFFMRAKVKEDT